MTPTRFRDQVSELAKTDFAKAEEIAKRITDPWFLAQAYAHLARYDKASPLRYARHAAKAAAKLNDPYKHASVRAWEIAALAERNYLPQARAALTEAVEIARFVNQQGSRAEALFLLFQAAINISHHDAEVVSNVLDEVCDSDHWRAMRARKNTAKILEGMSSSREFFW